MGWWSITDDRAGISFLSGEPEEKTGMHMGDGPADIMGEAVNEIVELYKQSFQRKPYMRELIAAVEFVAGSHELQETATQEYLEQKRERLWGEAREYLMRHATRRLRNHSEIGGSDFEIAQDVAREMIELCAKISVGEIPVNELPTKLELDDEQ